MNCEICNHAGHDAGQCRNCNCGEGSIVADHAAKYGFRLEDRIVKHSITQPGEFRYGGGSIAPKVRNLTERED